MATIVRCNCGAEYKRTETKFLVPHTGHASCKVCGAGLESWLESTHVPEFELVKGPKRKAGAYSGDGTCTTTTINPRRICLIAGLQQGFDAPGNPSRS